MGNASVGTRHPDKQGHRTPSEFINAVCVRFGEIGFDLAALDQQTAVAREFFSPEQDSLVQNWGELEHVEPTVWLNPPFAHIRPWVAKLDEECRTLPRWTLCLVPASMGSHWWADHVLGKCFALGVTRMTFQGSPTPYPKDLALLCYGFGVSGSGFWDWRAA